MNAIPIDLLLEYLYNKFAITFLICFVGVFIREAMVTVNECNTISIKRLLASSLFVTVIMCAYADYVKTPFSIYTLLCIVIGMWANRILLMVLNTKFINIFIRNLFKASADPIKKAIGDSVEELDKETSKDKEDDNTLKKE